MHLLALSAFRHETGICVSSSHLSLSAPFGAQCFPTKMTNVLVIFQLAGLNAPFGAQCFPTQLNQWLAGDRLSVSMHLLVLSAFRLGPLPNSLVMLCSSLNAPFGAQCFPTIASSDWKSAMDMGLNAPFGAQCFPTNGPVKSSAQYSVSMHLLVLSAFRPDRLTAASVVVQSQCTFWCSVLSDREPR